MIELKKEINELCQRHGEAARYPLEFEEERKEAMAKQSHAKDESQPRSQSTACPAGGDPVH
jgi:hypothetical protein